MNFYRPSDYDRVVNTSRAETFRRGGKAFGVAVYSIALLCIGFWLGWGAACRLLP